MLSIFQRLTTPCRFSRWQEGGGGGAHERRLIEPLHERRVRTGRSNEKRTPRPPKMLTSLPPKITAQAAKYIHLTEYN